MENELLSYFPEFNKCTPFNMPVELLELYDKSKAREILENEEEFKKSMRESLFVKENISPFVLLENYLEISNFSGKFKNKYEYFSDEQIGRLESIYPISVQNMPREIRDFMISGIYDNYDMTNAQPVILGYICEKLDIPHIALKYYIDNREKVLEELSEANNKDRVYSKVLVLEVMNGGYMAYRSAKKTQWLRRYYKEQQIILRRFTVKFPLFYREALKYKERTNLLYNVEGTCLNTILTTVENYALLAMCQFLKDNGVLKNVGILMYDGLYFPKNPKSEGLLWKCEQYIKKQINIPLKLKMD